ncbi:Tyrosine kinase-like (TKL) protein, putative, partial [Eimeria tenella]
VLCDSVGIPCRLMRGPPGPPGAPEFVYNVVLIGSGQEAELEHLMPILWGDTPETVEGRGAPQGGPQGAPDGGPLAAGDSGGPPSFSLQLNPPQLGRPPCSGSPCCSFCGPRKPCGSSKCIYLANQQQQQQQQQQLAAERDLDRFLLQASGGPAADLDLDYFFTFHDKLGKGNFGEVWRVSLKPHALRAPGHPPRSCSSSSSSSSSSSGRLGAARGSKKEQDAEEERGEQHAPQYALKLVPRKDENVPEAEIMRSYTHPRIVPFLGVFGGFQMLEDRTKRRTKHSSLCFLMHVADESLGEAPAAS